MQHCGEQFYQCDSDREHIGADRVYDMGTAITGSFELMRLKLAKEAKACEHIRADRPQHGDRNATEPGTKIKSSESHEALDGRMHFGPSEATVAGLWQTNPLLNQPTKKSFCQRGL